MTAHDGTPLWVRDFTWAMAGLPMGLAIALMVLLFGAGIWIGTQL